MAHGHRSASINPKGRSRRYDRLHKAKRGSEARSVLRSKIITALSTRRLQAAVALPHTDGIWRSRRRLYFLNSGTAKLSACFSDMGRHKAQQSVLIVDDEPLIRMYIRDVLEDAGHLAREASNAQDGLSLIAEGASH